LYNNKETNKQTNILVIAGNNKPITIFYFATELTLEDNKIVDNKLVIISIQLNPYINSYYL